MKAQNRWNSVPCWGSGKTSLDTDTASIENQSSLSSEDKCLYQPRPSLSTLIWKLKMVYVTISKTILKDAEHRKHCTILPLQDQVR